MKLTVAPCLLLVASTAVLADISVDSNGISWTDDGWYEVQSSDSFVDLCQGGTRCETGPGVYNIINHTTGERWESVSVGVSVTDGIGEDSSSVATAGSATLRELVNAAASISDPNSSLSIFDRALQATGLDEPLQQASDTYTVFAPTDSAFSVLGDAELEALLNDTDNLRTFVLRHILLGPSFNAAHLRLLAGFDIGAGNGEMLVPNYSGSTLSINQVNVSNPDIVAANGVIHMLEGILPAGSGYPEQGDSSPGEPLDDDSADTAPPTGDSIMTIVRGASGFSGDTGFSTLVLALQATGLDQTLAADTSTYTLFAPTDAAFQALGDDALATLFSDTTRLREVLLYHLINGAVGSANLTDGLRLETRNGSFLNVTLASGANRKINDAMITTSDITANNGVIHIIDQLLIPPVNASSGYNEDDSTAPSSDAGTSTDGSVSDTSAADTGATETSTDGSEEISDGGVTPEGNATVTSVLTAAGEFTTLLSLLELVGLLNVLDDPDGIYTVFAPTDSAFAAIPAEQLNELRNNPDSLRTLLLYHVLAGRRFMVEDLMAVDGRGIVAGNGLVVAITAGGSEGLRINTATVTGPDRLAGNSVIHTISEVLVLPAIDH